MKTARMGRKRTCTCVYDKASLKAITHVNTRYRTTFIRPHQVIAFASE